MTAVARPATGLALRLAPQRLIMAMFFVQAAALNNWFPRIPDIQAQLGLTPGQLAIALLGMPIGGLIGTAIAARVIEKITARQTLGYGFIFYGAIAVLPGWAWSLPALFAILFMAGIAYVIIDVAANVEATRIQDAIGRRILATCHGFWSLGSVLGLVAGSAFAEWQVEVRWHLLVAILVIVPIGFVIARALPQFEPKPANERVRPPFAALPSLPMLGLCVFAFGAIVGELTARNWGAVYLRETIGASAAATGVGFAAFSLFMTAGRLAGDRLTDRFGIVTLGRVCAALAVIGVVALVAANNLFLAVIGLAAMGAGVSVAFPLAITAAAGFGGGRSPAVNVAALSLVAYSGSLIGAPLVGFVADQWGLRVGLAAILPLVVLSAVFAGSLRPKAL